jgi:hypothetical protein
MDIFLENFNIIQEQSLLSLHLIYAIMYFWFLLNELKPGFCTFPLNIFHMHCKKFFLKIQEYIHEGANQKLTVPEFSGI